MSSISALFRVFVGKAAKAVPLCASGRVSTVRVFGTTLTAREKATVEQRLVPEATGPLSGYRVLDMTRVLAGPYCTQLLGDLGAEIIKIERKTGDDTRSWGPPFAKNVRGKGDAIQESAYFLSVNRNKKSVTVDYKSPGGLEIIKDLIRKCDVLVENYVPGKLDALGLGYEHAARLNPRLVYASITGYGPTGPYSQRPGYDVMTEAEAGLMYITGEPDRRPVKVGVAITDLTTGLYAHGAIMAALLSCMKTNKGQKLDISLLECQVASLVNIGSNYLIAGQEARRWGTSHTSIVPYQAVETKDGFIVIGAGNDRQFQILCNAIKQPQLASDARFSTNRDRVAHREELIEILEDIFRCKTTGTWLEILKGTEIPCAPINNIRQTFEHPQVIARRMIQEIDHPTAGKIKVAGIPVKYSRTKPSIRIPPPLLGQHTNEVLSQLLGYTDKKIKSLRQLGSI